MDNTYSTTQSTNLTAIIGVIVLVANHFGLKIGTEELTVAIGGTIAVVGVIMNWIHRYQKGDLTVGGFRKVTNR